jgi:hypothetical protein
MGDKPSWHSRHQLIWIRRETKPLLRRICEMDERAAPAVIERALRCYLATLKRRRR